jgi:hypothetical protein
LTLETAVFTFTFTPKILELASWTPFIAGAERTKRGVFSPDQSLTDP